MQNYKIFLIYKVLNGICLIVITLKDEIFDKNEFAEGLLGYLTLSFEVYICNFAP